MPSDQNLRTRLDFARESAVAAGGLVMSYFQTDIAVETKSDASPVTIADRKAEELLREMIARAYPSDAILGEEFGEQPGTTGYRWILDPIDGTKSFIHGVPLFGVLIGLEHNGSAVAGVAHLPALRETVYAAKGEGAWWLPAGHTSNDAARPARVSSAATLRDGLALTTSYDYWLQTRRTEVFHRIAAACRTRGWSDCYAHVLVATGRAEAAIEPVMSIWDSAPFQPILEEAGGTYTDWQGKPTIAGADSFSTNGRVFQEVLDLVRL
jgi:histidinol phosphatase-like enzyme (inositol monophosphatase family)